LNARPDYGIVAAACNNVGNPNQNYQGLGWRDEPRMVCFTCVLIPRRTINRVGLLCEEFTNYGFEDDAYCLEVRRAGLKIGIFDGCVVDHASLTPTFRSAAHAGGSLNQNRRIFVQKYGRHPL
jgi:GT2 family glycosyltransferase